MSEPNECYAYFAIAGDFDPQEITSRAGIAPTKAWRRGEIAPRTNRERRFSRWSLFSRLPRDRALEDHVADVLAQLVPRAGAFRALSQEYGGCMQLVGYFNGHYPGLHFDARTVVALADLYLQVDFDFYGLDHDDVSRERAGKT